jgi:NADH-quinone oxidoreductase subunit D
MDVGALTPPLWGFEEREKLMHFYERASGSRMHAKYFRVGGVHQDLPDELIADIAAFCETHPKVLDDIEEPADRKPHLQAAQRRHRRCVAGRMLPVGLFGRDGPWLGRRVGPAPRAALRVLFDEIEFDIPIGKNGDCYDRYLIRMLEMRESVTIMQQCCEKLLSEEGRGPCSSDDNPRSCRRSAVR